MEACVPSSKFPVHSGVRGGGSVRGQGWERRGQATIQVACCADGQGEPESQNSQIRTL